MKIERIPNQDWLDIVTNCNSLDFQFVCVNQIQVTNSADKFNE